MSKIFKSLIAAILVFTLSFGLFSCGDAGSGSPEKLKEAFDKEIDLWVDELSEGYDLIEDFGKQNIALDADLSVELSESLLSLLTSYTSYDFSWVNDAKITLSEVLKNDMVSAALGFSYNNTEIIEAEYIVDLLNGDMFVGIPVLNDAFAKLDIIPEGEEMPSFDILGDIDFKKLLPKEKEARSLLKSVLATLVDNLSDISYSDEELVVNGVKESCVEYVAKISVKDLVSVLAAELEMLAVSEDFKTIACDFIDEISKIQGIVGEDYANYTPEQMYEELKTEINGLAAKLRFLLAYEGAVSDIPIAVWTVYVTEAPDIIGTQFDIITEDDVISVYYATAHNNNDVGVEMYIQRGSVKLIELNGDLTDDGNMLSGTYELKLMGTTMLYVDIEDVDAKKLEDGYFIGSVTISPTKGLFDLISELFDLDMSDATALLSGASVKIDVQKNNGEHINATISLLVGRAAYASMTLDGKLTSGSQVKIPDKTTSDVNEWVNGFDLDKLIKNIQKAGLPDYIVDFIVSGELQSE